MCCNSNRDPRRIGYGTTKSKELLTVTIVPPPVRLTHVVIAERVTPALARTASR